ncbi:hypothetical protein HZR84_09770 [Hyphobacterium sp. CCMP332]|nr:hypothetical protein HZR84_09770 [Hyphobacterium sp. CCMP332]
MKHLQSIFLTLVFALSLIGCKKKSSQTSVNLTNIDLLRGEITLCGSGEFGEVSFALSCDLEVRETFDLAISLLHSFEYTEAEKAFVKVLDADPECAMAYWGIAMSNFHSLWLQTGTDYLAKGAKIIEASQSVIKSEKEEAYLNAIAGFYNDWENVSRQTRINNFERGMRKIYEKYSDDKEAAIFYALALRASADPADKTYVKQRESGRILETIYPDQPNHPGIAHYIIHNYDYPELAELALPTARRYAQIAPASAHAQHMPSHIFTRLGLWNESIKSNLNSTSSALCYSASIDSNAHWDEELHSMDYLVYAYLQVGNNQKAIEQYEYMKTFKKVFPANFKIAYTGAAIPSRIALENKNWSEAAKLELPSMEIDWDNFPWEKSILRFARAIGSVRSGDVAAAEKELAILQANQKKLIDLKDEYKANQIEIQIKTIQAWISFAKGAENESIALMQEAATNEYNTSKHPVTPGEVLPAGELLGDLLLELKKPEDALKAFEYDLSQHPNRFNGLYGAGIAAIRIGDVDKANKYFGLLLELTKDSPTERKEIEYAKKYLTIIEI